MKKVMAVREMSHKEMFFREREGLSSTASLETLRGEREETDDRWEELLRLVVQAPLQRSKGVCRQAR